MLRILVATRDGLHSLTRSGDRSLSAFAGRSVTSVARDGSALWAILDAVEVVRSADGETWETTGRAGDLRATCVASAGDVLVGTSEARLFRVTSGGIEPVDAFDVVDGRETWFTPWGGPPDTRSIAEWDEFVYVNVHVGGILRTQDRGQAWTPTIDVDADVHEVTTADGLVLAACAGGLATSTDHGATWTLRREGLVAPYARAVTVCGDTVLVSASNGPRGGRGAVGTGEGPRERLVRAVAGLDRDVQDGAIRRHQPVGGPLQEHPPAERARRLTGRRRHHAIEVVPREVDAGGKVGSGGLVIVQGRGQDLDEGAEGVGRGAHVPILVESPVHGLIGVALPAEPTSD